jgi:hypothetical protein
MSDEHPDMEELDFRLEMAAEKMSTIFEVMFEISIYDAELLLNLWDDATAGDTEAVYALMGEVKKLIDVLREEIDDV